MSNTKILDLIPENLKPLFIEEVKQLLAEEAKKNEKTPEEIKKDLESDILKWAKEAQSKTVK